MTVRFLAAVLILLFAAFLQFSFAGAGLSMNFLFAALIALAFLFGLPEVIFFVLFGVFVLNWQPGLSPEVVLFVAIPLVAYIFHRFSSWEAWAANLIAIITGLLLFYIAISPGTFLGHIGTFLLDLVSSLIFGGFVFFILNRRTGR